MRALLEAEIPHLRRYARALVRDAEEADDLVQACLERALENAERWDSTRRLRPWLFRIQHNIYISWLRRRERERNYSRRYPPRSSIEGEQDASIELRTVERALAELPEEQRATVLLVALEGLSYQEVAEILAVPVGTVRSRLSRGRGALRAALDGTAAKTVAPGGVR